MKLTRDDLGRILLASVLSSTPIAFMTFDFMLPNLTVPSLERNLLLIFLMSILTGMPSGYISRRIDGAMITVFLYVSIGYALALILYSIPFTVFGMQLVLPELYYVLFVRITIILLFLFVLGGFIGTVLGTAIQDAVRREETRLTFRDLK